MILASASPRRAAILEGLGVSFDVYPARVHESILVGESPEEHALRLSTQKALAVAHLHSGEWVLGGDTLVTIDGGILGKPRDPKHAVEMLLSLQGRTHQVVSALALVVPGVRPPDLDLLSDVQVTAVTFRSFGEETALAYAKTREPQDKAGAYGIQGRGAALVERIEGDYTGVVGLPVPLLLRLLEQAGKPYRFPD